jgi:hypothetical protein
METTQRTNFSQVEALRELTNSSLAEANKLIQELDFERIDSFLAEGPLQPLAHYQVIRRNGALVPFFPNDIALAMENAFLRVHGRAASAAEEALSCLSWLVAHPTWSFVTRILGLPAISGCLHMPSPDMELKARRAPNAHGFFSATKVNLRNAP